MSAEIIILWKGIPYHLVPEEAKIHQSVFPPGFPFVRHTHPAYHLILVEQASCTLDVTGCSPLLCRENTLLLINPNVEHRFIYADTRGCMHSSLIWNFVDAAGRRLLRPLQELGGRPGREALRPYAATVLTPVQASGFRLRQRECERFLSRRDPGVSSLKFFNLVSFGMELLWGDHWPRGTDSGRLGTADNLTERIQTLIETHFPDPDFTVRRLAGSLQFSVSYLNAVFSRENGCSIATALRMRRLEYARELLKNTTHSVKYIYEQCGFTRQNYFAAAFRRESGMTPLEYRKHFRRGTPEDSFS